MKVEDFQKTESDWSLSEIMNLSININRYIPIRGGLSTFVALPKDLQRKKAVVNIMNEDAFCFLWSVTAALSPATANSDRKSSYRHFSEVLRYEGLEFPMKLKNVPKFEQMNELMINVYGIETHGNCSEIVPVYLSKQKSQQKTIHLLMIETDINSDKNNDNDDDDAEDTQRLNPIHHFAYIKNLSRLISSQISRHNGKTWLCDRCLCHFKTENV